MSSPAMIVRRWLLKVTETFAEVPPVLPFYHLVSDDALPHVRHIYPYKNERQFIEDIDFLGRHYRPVSLADLIESAKSGRRLKKGSFIVTFDDGYREIDTVVAPILFRKGIPAIFFLTTDWIDNKALGHDNKASLIIDHLLAYEKRHPGSPLPVPDLAAGSIELAVQRILALRRREQARLDEIAAAIGLDFEEFLRARRPYLDYAQIRTLVGRGFYIGAHSCDHPYFRDLSLQDQLRQALGSVQILKDRFGLPYSVFAFPHHDHGVDLDFFRNTEQSLDLTFGTDGLRPGLVPTNLQRINFERSLMPAAEILLRHLAKSVIDGQRQPR